MNRTFRARRSAVATVALLGATSLVLAGCAGGDSGEVTNEDGQVVLTLGSWLPTADQWPDMIALFEEQNPDIAIEYTPSPDYTPFIEEFDNQILAGEVPDVFGIQPGASFDDYAEYALPVDEYASDFIGDVQESAIESTTTSDGEVAAVPILTAGSEFYLYNKTVFDELGVTLPQNYDELVSVAQTARAAGFSPFAMGASDAWHDGDFFVWLSNQYGEGGDIYKAAAGEIPWDSETLVDAATRWQQLFTDGVFQDAATTTSTYPAARDDFFLARKSIAMPTGSWHVGATLNTSLETPGSAVEADELGMAVFPTIGDNEAGVTNGVDFAFAVNADIDPGKIEAATKFVQFMATGDGQQYWVDNLQGFAAAKGVEPQLGADEPAIAVESVAVVSEALAASEWPRKIVVPGNSSLETDLGVVLQNIATGADPASELATLNG